jgi:hypothetical protein
MLSPTLTIHRTKGWVGLKEGPFGHSGNEENPSPYWNLAKSNRKYKYIKKTLTMGQRKKRRNKQDRKITEIWKRKNE